MQQHQLCRQLLRSSSLNPRRTLPGEYMTEQAAWLCGQLVAADHKSSRHARAVVLHSKISSNGYAMHIHCC
jgi:hypothetical protein